MRVQEMQPDCSSFSLFLDFPETAELRNSLLKIEGVVHVYGSGGKCVMIHTGTTDLAHREVIAQCVVNLLEDRQGVEEVKKHVKEMVESNVLSRLQQKRLLTVLSCVGGKGKAQLSTVLDALYPGLHHEAQLSNFRSFRLAIRKKFEGKLTLCTDSKTRTTPEYRHTWFEISK